MTDREKAIKNYLEGYNQFDVEKMVADFDENIVFENIQNGVPTMTLIGLKDFIQQAEKAKSYFSKRTQVVKSFVHQGNQVEVEIDYLAILGMDFPNGLKKGQELNLVGKSIFEFEGQKIIKLTDIS